MSDLPPGAGPVPPPDPDPDQTRVIPPDRSPDGPKQRFVDRLWTFRALIAVALASVILGGLGGAALANAGNKDDNRRGGPFPGRMGQRPGNPMMPPGQGGQLAPPGTRQWQWNDGPDRRGTGQRQWGEDQNPQVVPPTPTPTPKN